MCCLVQLEVSCEEELLLPELLVLFCPLVALTCRGTRWLEDSLADFSPCPELVLLRTLDSVGAAVVWDVEDVSPVDVSETFGPAHMVFSV